MLIVTSGQTVEILYKGPTGKDGKLRPLPESEWVTFRARVLTASEYLVCMADVSTNQEDRIAIGFFRAARLCLRGWQGIRTKDSAGNVTEVPFPEKGADAADMLPGDVAVAIGAQIIARSQLEEPDRKV